MENKKNEKNLKLQGRKKYISFYGNKQYVYKVGLTTCSHKEKFCK